MTTKKQIKSAYANSLKNLNDAKIYALEKKLQEARKLIDQRTGEGLELIDEADRNNKNVIEHCKAMITMSEQLKNKLNFLLNDLLTSKNKVLKNKKINPIQTSNSVKPIMRLFPSYKARGIYLDELKKQKDHYYDSDVVTNFNQGFLSGFNWAKKEFKNNLKSFKKQ